jgi:hypothetical protein
MAGAEERLSLNALHDRAGRRGQGATPLCVEPRRRHTIALDLYRDAYEIATGCASGRARVGVVPQGALASGRAQMFGE